MKKTVLTLIAAFVSCIAMAQTTNTPIQMADGMRSNGKIYVVVAVLLTVLAGLFIYVIRLDRKISKLEKNGEN